MKSFGNFLLRIFLSEFRALFYPESKSGHNIIITRGGAQSMEAEITNNFLWNKYLLKSRIRRRRAGVDIFAV